MLGWHAKKYANKVHKDTYIALHLFMLQLDSGVKKMQGWSFIYLSSLLYHPYLVCILFGMHLSTFLNVVIFLLYTVFCS